MRFNEETNPSSMRGSHRLPLFVACLGDVEQPSIESITVSIEHAQKPCSSGVSPTRQLSKLLEVEGVANQAVRTTHDRNRDTCVREIRRQFLRAAKFPAENGRQVIAAGNRADLHHRKRLGLRELNGLMQGELGAAQG
jgi:hypothetical protein